MARHTRFGAGFGDAIGGLHAFGAEARAAST